MYGQKKTEDESTAPVTNLVHESEAGAVARVVRHHLRAQLVDLGGGHKVLVRPKDSTIESVKPLLEEYLYDKAPKRRRGTATLQDLESFIAHAVRFHDEDSALFGDRTVPSLTSVLDYHHPGELVSPGGADRGARFGTHRGVYTFPLSEEWKAWRDASNRPMNQATFAEFIERRIVDVYDPSQAGNAARALAEKVGLSYVQPSKLLDLSKGLSLHVSHTVTNAVRLESGETRLQFETTHSSPNGAPVSVPGGFLIAIPVFRSGAPYQIPVRLRYRVNDGKITWSVEMHDPEASFDHAFAEACEEARTKTGLPLFMGSPEV